MIFIISKEGDIHVKLVTEWLTYYNQSYFVYNSDKVVVVDYLTRDGLSDDFVLTIDDHKVRYSDITAFWYVRGDLLFLEEFDFANDDGLIISYNRFVEEETRSLRNYIYYLLCKKTHINDPLFRAPNKLVTLAYANLCGLKTPFSIVTSLKNEVKKHTQPLVVKPIQEILSGANSTSYWQSYTTLLESSILEDFDNVFFPSLLQEKLEVEYELRIFYLDNKFVSMAIIADSSNSSIIDSRFYSKSTFTKYVSYQLPKSVENKLSKLMRMCSLRSGSIDMIKTKQDEYVFLEINPSGFFSPISVWCNVKVEKIIAEYLIQKL